MGRKSVTFGGGGCNTVDGQTSAPVVLNVKLFISYLSVRWCRIFSINSMDMRGLHPRSLTARPWKMVVGRLLSDWDDNFSGATQNFGRVYRILWSHMWRNDSPSLMRSAKRSLILFILKFLTRKHVLGFFRLLYILQLILFKPDSAHVNDVNA